MCCITFTVRISTNYIKFQILILLRREGGHIMTCYATIYRKCLCSHRNNTALINTISVFDTALVMTNT